MQVYSLNQTCVNRVLISTTVKAVADSIKKEIRETGLDLAYCRGQGYGGAGNMSGKCIGAAKLINNDNEKAVFIHCLLECLTWPPLVIRDLSQT